MTSRIKFHRKPEAPSIPSQGLAYGYEECEDGSLKKQDPPKKDNSIGPAFYNPAYVSFTHWLFQQFVCLFVVLLLLFVLVLLLLFFACLFIYWFCSFKRFFIHHKYKRNQKNRYRKHKSKNRVKFNRLMMYLATKTEILPSPNSPEKQVSSMAMSQTQNCLLI